VDPTVGAIRRATDTGQPFQISEIDQAREYVFREVTLRAGFHALLAAPIPAQNITRGITVFRRAGGRFEPRVVDLVVALANQSKVAIDNASLFQEVQNQRLQLERLSRDLEHLYRLSSALQEPLSLKEQLERVLEAASRMGILDRIYIWAVSPDAAKLVNLAGAGFAADEWKDFEGTEIPLPEAGAMYKAYQEGVPLVFNEANPFPPELALRPPYSELRAIRTRNFLIIPMIARGVTVGLLTGDNKWSGRPLLPETVALLQTFASHAAVAIANARLFHAIEEKSQQLEVATRHKSQFLANMSHELRTPLNAIIGYTELMADGVYGEVPEKTREVLDRVEKAGRHLLGLINDVLDLSKIEAGQLTLSLADYSMADVVQTVALAVEPLATEKGLALQAQIPPELPVGRGDYRRLTQVLLNLAGNAVKFTDAGEVTIRLTAADGMFTVSVSDTGPGISPEDRERIFEEFQQVDKADTRKKEGTGLGLAIARRIVELHGGRLWLESAPGRGSTFAFAVPIRVERRARMVPVAVERRAAS
jgi:signal transduction histidine kinase